MIYGEGGREGEGGDRDRVMGTRILEVSLEGLARLQEDRWS